MLAWLTFAAAALAALSERCWVLAAAIERAQERFRGTRTPLGPKSPTTDGGVTKLFGSEMMRRTKAAGEETAMTEVVKVSTADVERAQLVVKLNDYVGKPTPDSIRRIAAAHSLNGHRHRSAS